MQTISYSALRANLAETMDQVTKDHVTTVVTRSKAKSVVMISLEDYEAMEETYHLMKSPANALRLIASIEEIESKISRKKKK